MRKILVSFIALAVIANIVVEYVKHHTPRQKQGSVLLPAPQEGEEGEENEKKRELYNELRHRAAPGVHWKTIENNNRLNALSLIAAHSRRNARPMAPASFANGALNGVWEERGARNVTGSVRAVDYTASDNRLYVVSNGGSLWTSVMGTGSWSLLNQSVQMDGSLLRAFNTVEGTRRILVSFGNNIQYSDDEGATFSSSSGINFPVSWGGNYIAALIRVNDPGNTIYCLTRPWSDNPWGARYWLYQSTDEGLSFSRIYQFNTGDDEKVSICNPYNSNTVYITQAGGTDNSITLYSVSGSSVNLVNTFNGGQNINRCVIKGTVTGSTTLYALVNNNSMYRLSNSSGGWQMQLQGTLPEDAWSRLNVSPSDASKVFFGGVNAFKSNTNGQSWTKINEWWEYYGSEASRLHADIMAIEFFTKSDGSEFAVVNCHGGVYSSSDLLTTVHNESLSSLVAVEYYDVLTDTLRPNIILSGSQDQGIQHTLTGTNAGIQDFKQLLSGDYGQLCLSKNNTNLWAEYPGGRMYIFSSLNTASPQYLVTWTMGGTQQSNYGWMIPAKSTVNAAANEIWIGGGNINNGTGSYLAKATLSNDAPYTVTATQFNYNFRSNSNSGTSGISALEQSPVNSNKLYVAAEDGTFFYSNNLGSSWSKTASFSGPGTWYLYGSCILASKLTANLVWYTGSGYSNPPVYKSVDGGLTFTPMSNGLPSTLVNEIAASPDESFLFAATEAGPYVYVASDNTWYPMYDGNTPVQFYSGVQYIAATNTVRFSTMGRGIWDFRISTTYTFTGNGNWSTVSNWAGNAVPPANLPAGSAIFINPAVNGECIVNIPVTVPANCSLTVNPGKKLRVNGNLIIIR